MRANVIGIAAVVLLAFTACGGQGGGDGAVPPAPRTPLGAASGKAAFTIAIANPRPSASQGARPAFVSPSTNGVQVLVYAHSDTSHTAARGPAVTDVPPGSRAGTSPGSPLTGTLNVGAPAGNDDFVFTLYDTAPSGGTIPASAHILGVAGVTHAIVANATNTVNAGIGGVIDGLSGQPAFMSVPANGSPQAIGLTIHPTDFGNNPIVAGSPDPYANPIVATLTEIGGSGHAALQLNGGTPSSSVTSTKSTDTIAISYDGKGAPGYGIAVALAAAAVAGQGGAIERAAISPLILSSTNAHYVQGTASVQLSGNGDFVPFTISELNPPATPTYTVTLPNPNASPNCDGIAMKQTLSAASFNLLALGASSASGCTVVVSDGSSSLTLAVSNAYSATLGTPTFAEYPVTTPGSAPWGIAAGPDGALWFTESSAIKVGRITTAGTISNEYALSHATFVTPFGITTAPDGNLWFGADNANPPIVARIASAGTVTPFSVGAQWTNNVAAGPDGNLWFTECSNGGKVGYVTPAGVVSEHGGPRARAELEGITAGPDGAMWFAESGLNLIGRMTTAGTLANEYTVPTAGASPYGITVGPDGALWFTERGADQIGRISTGGAVTEFPVPTANAEPTEIVAGPDGALWFTESNASQIGRIPTNATPGSGAQITEYPTPTAGSLPAWIAVGPDGNLWFTESAANAIGRLTI